MTQRQLYHQKQTPEAHESWSHFTICRQLNRLESIFRASWVVSASFGHLGCSCPFFGHLGWSQPLSGHSGGLGLFSAAQVVSASFRELSLSEGVSQQSLLLREGVACCTARTNSILQLIPVSGTRRLGL